MSNHVVRAKPGEDLRDLSANELIARSQSMNHFTLNAQEAAKHTPGPWAPIASRGKWPSIGVAERANHSDAKLYAWGEVPHMDARDEDYVFEVKIHTADPDQEQALARYVSTAITELPRFIDAMTFALEKLDSVAFLSKEGDTNIVKQSLRAAIAKATGAQS